MCGGPNVDFYYQINTLTLTTDNKEIIRMMNHKPTCPTDRPAAETAPIDWNDLFDRIPDESVILQFAASYRDSSLALFGRLEQSIAQQDAKLIESNAHALKGSAANLGAVLLAKAAWQLENAAHKQEQSNLQSLFENVRREFTRVMDLLSHPDWIDQFKKSQSA